MAEKKRFVQPDLTIEELSAALYISKEQLQRSNEKLFQTNQKLQQANEQLHKAQKERSELLANISHDLRSPITAVKNTVEYMESLDTYETEEMKSLIALMKGRMDSLQHLVNDFFLLTTVENTTIPFHMTPVQMGPLLEEFFFSRECDEKYRERILELQVPDDFPYKASIDPVRMEQVLDNLFMNAWKYSQKDARIILGACGDGRQITITVTDTGMGIPADKVDRIFERSYMVDESRTPGAKTGCGLGLSIVNQIVQRLQGQVTCQSTVGEGSRFIITLPIVE